MRATPRFEDVAIGTELPALRKGPLTTTHLMRWSAAMENWHKIHYDAPYAQQQEKLPGLLINGSLKQQFVMQLLKDWAGPEGWVWKARLQFRAMNLVGETLSVWARIVGKRQAPAFGLLDLELGIVNEAGVESTPGTAIVALPYRDGPPLPYPFVPPAAATVRPTEGEPR
ncbi:MAG: acyl dehydratase [Burkholderiales bacterium]|nr:acyl dehydratase [Burkholderiales bacterium]ODU70253.1 MAG: acyl dehydratase [Lautropia sp. SCN 66-9]